MKNYVSPYRCAMQFHQSSGLHCVGNPTATLALETSLMPRVESRDTVSRSPWFFRNVLSSEDTWYRFIIKKVDPMSSSYFWSEMSFYSTWSREFNVNICFDVPKASQLRIVQGLSTHEQPFDAMDVYASHGIILGEILVMYDESIWALRDGVRQIEMVCYIGDSFDNTDSRR